MSVQINVEKAKFVDPSPYGFTIYTKPGCSFCTKVKDLLKKRRVPVIVVECEDYLLEDKEGFLSFIQRHAGGKSWRTFPIVFYAGNFVGGYTDTEKWFAKNDAFQEIL
jgi:glutaredoxin